MRRPGDLLPRLGVALVGIPVVLYALYRGGWILGGLVAAVAVLGAWEFYTLVRLRGDRPFPLLGSAAAGGTVLLATFHGTLGAFAAPAVLLLLAVAGASLALGLFVRWPGGSPAGALASTVAGVVYVGIPMAFLPLLRSLGDRVPGVETMGPWIPMAFVLFPLLVTWAGDTLAYLVGSMLGRVKLAPSVSPGKSVEGAVGGVVGSVGAAALMAQGWLAGLPGYGIPVATAMWMGLVLSVGTQVGDLAESLLKREAGVKDSGKLLPGHGGFLDRLDALLWAFPLTWVLLALAGAMP